MECDLPRNGADLILNNDLYLNKPLSSAGHHRENSHAHRWALIHRKSFEKVMKQRQMASQSTTDSTVTKHSNSHYDFSDNNHPKGRAHLDGPFRPVVALSHLS
ncbi:MAG: hypothetical protein ACRD8U_10035 [Pyrinomonadaceae bacterium]